MRSLLFLMAIEDRMRHWKYFFTHLHKLSLAFHYL